jgi:hypothetical protein
MGLFGVDHEGNIVLHVYHHVIVEGGSQPTGQLDRIETLLTRLLERTEQMEDQITALESEVAGLGTVAESVDVTIDRILALVEAAGQANPRLEAVLNNLRTHKAAIVEAVAQGTAAENEEPPDTGGNGGGTEPPVEPAPQP